ncbi:MAG TPA: TldD/PmbA family protein [Dehalococcoidia bacterium]|nr:TldD/PmbA family protein [Dehalococcoidia bacterium]
MVPAVTIETLDEIEDIARSLVTEYVRRLPGLRYADLRIEVSQGKGAVAENGQAKESREDYDFAFGVRTIAGSGKLTASGYYNRQLGAADLPRIEDILKEGLRHAHRRAVANARQKALARREGGALGRALTSTELASIPVRQETVPARYRLDPRQVPLPRVLDYVVEASQAVAALDAAVAYNFVTAGTGLTRQLLCSSEGALLDQASAISEGFAFVVAQGPEASQEIYDFMGHQAGWDVVTEGVATDTIRYPDLKAFALELARDTVALARSRPLKATDKDVVVVTDPHYNALLCHEVVGHPTELDRALKMETGYAGRSWLLRDLRDTQMGSPIASDLVNAFSDPTVDGFGHYTYDDEGTPGRRLMLIDKGVFEGFMNSRETAAIVGAEPNGHYKATDASYVPLIRMSNTAFAPGDRDPREIVREVEHGYYLAGHRIPSVAESRENFRITAMKVYEIRNGEMGELFRDGGIIADTRDFFMSIDAVGNDFRLFAIPNCGKGQPMQTKRMGNGGPTMRGRARLSGA